MLLGVFSPTLILTFIEAKNVLKQQTTVILEWFDQNHLIANPDKFHLMFLSTDKTDQLVNEQLFIGDKTLNSKLYHSCGNGH